MLISPDFYLDATSRSDLPSVTKIYHISDADYFLWVKVPIEYAKATALYQLAEIAKDGKHDICLSDMCYHESGRIWYRFNSMYLNRSSGQHIYRMSLINTVTELTHNLYFSYIIQREDVDKSYIYMPNLKSEEVKLK